ncbi:MAG: DegT/DnrJ/EryC1/StrS family aminotransferase [Tannerellaceae bacterium]|nr:DegT/DnrJ/EryC1/StrS family aminotransferase [Tannerellaceae bacterium]
MAITFDDSIQMVDLQTQYYRLKEEINAAIQEVLNSHAYINGPQVATFAHHFAEYLNVPHVIPCANGTDAIQIALMALNIQAGDEVIVPAFNYVAAAEAPALLGMTPVLVDVNPNTFNIDPQKIEHAISRRTKAIIAVHLFGQSCEMEPILRIAEKYNLSVIEDNAQSVGAVYTFPSGEAKKTGTIGHVGTTSFFPSKPLACYGDGGALMTSGEELSERIRMIANHGQEVKYHHKYIGCNSRLDTLQAAILNVKLKYISDFTKIRIKVAKQYNEEFKYLPYIIPPYKSSFSTHVYHQYTIQVKGKKRNELQSYLKQKGIPSMVYYPVPMDRQEAFRMHARKTDNLTVARQLSESVLSLPIHSEMRDEMQDYIIEHVKRFFKITG